MRRTVAVVLALVAATAAGCTRAPDESEAVADETETLGLFSDGTAAGPVAKLGLAATALKDALLVSPHYAIAFSRWAVTPELTEEQLETADVAMKDAKGMPVGIRDVRAPAGHELFIVDAGEPGATALSTDGSINKVDFTLVVGGERRPLGNTLYGFHVRNALIAVVPAGAEIRLDLTDEGRTQSLNLRTGKRTNAAAAFYPMRKTVAAPSETWRHRDGTYTSVGAHIVATLSPWADGKGWAPQGRAWLTGTVSVTATSAKPTLPPEPVLTRTLIDADLGKDLRLSGKGVPERLFPTGTSALVVDAVEVDPGLPEAAKSRPFAVEVPESLQKFTVEFTPDVTDPKYVRDPDLSDRTQEATLKPPKR